MTDYTARLSDEDYLRTYGFARPVRTPRTLTPAQREIRARLAAEVRERQAAEQAAARPRFTTEHLQAAR